MMGKIKMLYESEDEDDDDWMSANWLGDGSGEEI